MFRMQIEQQTTPFFLYKKHKSEQTHPLYGEFPQWVSSTVTEKQGNSATEECWNGGSEATAPCSFTKDQDL